MGISLSMIEKMQGLSLFGKGRISVLDIGSSNLYSASADGIQQFLATQGVASTREVASFAEKLAKGSAYDPVHGGANESFVGELFERAGIQYAAIDIADGYRTTILDLNHSPAPPHFVGAFDLVLNFGTTEHLLNQYNAFRVMHDSTKVGGYIVNSLPGAGYSNHGYFTYTPRCLFDLAGYNEYELVSFWFEGPTGSNDLFAPVRDYLSYFPNLARTLADREQTETGRKIAALDIPDVGIVVVYRKVKARPFMGALEKSTSVGSVPSSVTSSYESAQSLPAAENQRRDQPSTTGIRAKLRELGRSLVSSNTAGRTNSIPVGSASCEVSRHDEISLTGEAQPLREKLLAGHATPAEGLRLYTLMTESGQAFPVDWEELVLKLSLAADPERRDLIARLRHVLTVQGKSVPPDIEKAFADYAIAEERARDNQVESAKYHSASAAADMDQSFLPIYESCRAYTMTSVERMYALFKAIKYLEDAGISGDIVECGVWRGGSMMVAAHTLISLGCTTRNLYLFDTYEGLPRPDEDKDVDIWGNRAIDGWLPLSVGNEKSHWAEAAQEEVKANLLSTGYPAERLHLVKGMVERTIPSAALQRIALLRLDTDWYASTKHELEHLFQKLSRHGVLIIDDYGHFKGARQAVDEFIQSRGVSILLHRIDYSGRVGIKISD